MGGLLRLGNLLYSCQNGDHIVRPACSVFIPGVAASVWRKSRALLATIASIRLALVVVALVLMSC